MPNSESLETYLSQIAHELRDLPAQARADELREIESHLRALVLASQQIEDVSHVLATNIALQQFGPPRKVGRNLRRAWERKQPEAWWRAVVALSLGLAMWTVFNFAAREFFLAYLFDHGVDMYGVMAGTHAPVDFSSALIPKVLFYMQISGVFTSFATGYAMGLISPKHRTVIVGSVMFLLMSKQILTTLNSPAGMGMPNVLEFAIIFFFLSIGSRLAARQSRRREAKIADAK